MSNVVNIDSLNRQAVTYDPYLRTLPFQTLEEITAKFGFSVMEITGKHVKTSFHRRGGLMKPYSTEVIDKESPEVGKLVESELSLAKAYCSIFDHIDNYKSVNVLSNAGEKVDNKTKKHPLEKQILENVVRTWSEDVVDTIFFGERDTADQSPMGAFDGIETKLTALITAGEVSTAKGNLIESGDIVYPTDASTAALDSVVAWFRAINPKMRRNKRLLWIVPEGVLLSVIQAIDNKLQYRSVATAEHVKDYLKVHALVNNLEIITDPCLGTGKRWYLTQPGNFDFGMNTKSDGQFVQVRNPKIDPNIVQFWIQAEYGTRINEHHSSVLAVNELAAVASPLSGDYQIAAS